MESIQGHIHTSPIRQMYHFVVLAGFGCKESFVEGGLYVVYVITSICAVEMNLCHMPFWLK